MIVKCCLGQSILFGTLYNWLNRQPFTTLLKKKKAPLNRAGGGASELNSRHASFSHSTVVTGSTRNEQKQHETEETFPLIHLGPTQSTGVTVVCKKHLTCCHTNQQRLT